MATYYYNAQATGANNGSSKTDAFQTYAAFVAAMTVDGDIGYHHAASQEELSATVTYTFQASVNVFCIDFTTDALTDPHDVGGFVGSSTTNHGITLAGLSLTNIYISHLRMLMGGSSSRSNFINTGLNAPTISIGVLSFETNTHPNCVLELGSSNVGGSTRLIIDHLRLTRNATTGNTIRLRNARIDLNNVSILGTSTAAVFAVTAAGGLTIVKNSDFSNLASGATLVGSIAATPAEIVFNNCKLPSNYVLLASSVDFVCRISAFDCAVGDTHISFHVATDRGEVVVDTGKYANDNIGDANLSWKITTTAKVTRYTPFAVPPIPRRHRTTGSVTPWFAVAREGSASAFTNGEVWAEFSAKETDASVVMTVKSDKALNLATPANQTTDGDTTWTGLGGTNWKGKVGEQAFTVAEHGFIQGQLYVGLANAELRLDPQVRI